MNELAVKIKEALKEIQERNGYPMHALGEDVKIVAGLGFSSLDVAELVAVLEMELGVDPFSAGVSIMSVHSIGDLCNVYQEQINKAEPA